MTKQKSRKPLIMWCRWHSCTLRLRGRDANSVWGEFAYDDGSEPDTFHFDLTTWQLTRGSGASATTVELDDMGIEAI